MDQVDRRSINGLPLESKTPAQAKEELLGEIRIPAAIQVSLYVFAACYSSIFLPHLSQSKRQKVFSEVIYTLVLCIEWRALLTTFWNTIGFLLRVIRTRGKYGLGEGIDYVQRRSAAFAVGEVFLHHFCGSTVSLLPWKLNWKEAGAIYRKEVLLQLLVDWSINRSLFHNNFYDLQIIPNVRVFSLALLLFLFRLKKKKF